MDVGQVGADAVLLGDGDVFMGGELYDPVTGTWSSTGRAGSGGETATLLVDGRVLLTGAGRAATVYDDPTTHRYFATGSLVMDQFGASAVRLADGRVLLAGGMDASGRLGRAEVYDPLAGTWSETGSMGTGRGRTMLDWRLPLTLLPNGKVLLEGGVDQSHRALASAELYDPSTGTWSPTGSMATPRQGHTATLLSDGRVLVAGGTGYAEWSAELYDPATGNWSATGRMHQVRIEHTATRLLDGRVLVAGGDAGPPELYSPDSGTWSLASQMNTMREAPSAILLRDGRVLVAGGYSGGLDVASAETYLPDRGP